MARNREFFLFFDATSGQSSRIHVVLQWLTAFLMDQLDPEQGINREITGKFSAQALSAAP
jgi:hypothetical protein